MDKIPYGLKIKPLYLALGVCALLFNGSAFSQSEPLEVESAMQTYRYLTSTLRMFTNTGRLLNNPGIDGSDLEPFVDMLVLYRGHFDANFSINSAMCQFYLNPENGRMTLEEKAEIALSFLPSLDVRILRYVEIDSDFKRTMELEFGGLVLEKIEDLKKTVESSQQLPTSNFNEAAAVTFIDSACV
ncbi:MAG: hypothetical protein AB8B95_08250 [Pseudohongiellaceae bacterium]